MSMLRPISDGEYICFALTGPAIIIPSSVLLNSDAIKSLGKIPNTHCPYLNYSILNSDSNSNYPKVQLISPGTRTTRICVMCVCDVLSFE